MNSRNGRKKCKSDGLERAMGFEPHSAAGSALKLASQLPLRGPSPSCAPHERGVPLSKSPAVGVKSH